MVDSGIWTSHLWIHDCGDTRHMSLARHQRLCRRFCASWAKLGIGKKTPTTELLNWIYSFRENFPTENKNRSLAQSCSTPSIIHTKNAVRRLVERRWFIKLTVELYHLSKKKPKLGSQVFFQKNFCQKKYFPLINSSIQSAITIHNINGFPLNWRYTSFNIFVIPPDISRKHKNLSIKCFYNTFFHASTVFWWYKCLTFSMYRLWKVQKAQCRKAFSIRSLSVSGIVYSSEITRAKKIGTQKALDETS